jgi:putative ABC transport system permease protein
MLAHYLAVALAKFGKAPFTTASAVLTLSLGLACFIAAYGVAVFMRSGDGYHPRADRLFYVCRDCDRQYGAYQSPTPLAAALADEIPELEAVARFRPGGPGFQTERAVSTGERKAFLKSAIADPALFDLLGFELVEGDSSTALRARDAVVLTEDAARRLFGDEPALGRPVRIAGRRDGFVSAVIRPLQAPSMWNLWGFDFEILTNLPAELDPRYAETWDLFADLTVVRLPPSMTVEAFQARLDSLVDRRVPKNPDGAPRYTLGAVPIGKLMTAFIGSPVVVAAVPLGLGLLILLVAGVNYANLAAAQAEARLKETAMRKVLGAGRLQLLAQYAFEAGLLIVPALALAVAIVALAAPVFRQVGLDVTYFLTRGPGTVIFLSLLTIVTAVAVALYPAFRTARAKAADALGPGAERTGSGFVARMLVGVQFFSASLLLIVVTVIQLQLAHVEDVGLDRTDDPIVILNDFAQSGASFEMLAAQLSGAPQIRSMTATSQAPFANARMGMPVAGSEAAGAQNAALGATSMFRWAGADYFETLGFELLAGRGFDAAADLAGPSPGGAIVIDQRLAQTLGFGEPEAAVGRTLYRSAPQNGPAAAGGPATTPLGVVVGVMEADRSQLGENEFAGSIVAFDPDYAQSTIPVIRIDPEDIPGGLAAIERAWEAVAPDIPLRPRFADEQLRDNGNFALFRTIGGVFIVLCVCAIAISTTGLMGIAVYVAARRRREMGVRKTLGATALRIGRILIVDFSKPVLIANLLAWPLGYLAAQLFLQLFPDRISITPLTFLASLAITLAIAWAAVLGEVLKAASVRPAEVLRHA